ncbi:MAG: hypothetical protein K2X91_09585, partial [Thermoleophilia bacterium]|nr:hypothetical protein [Thermoleophilia bacterium]
APPEPAVAGRDLGAGVVQPGGPMQTQAQPALPVPGAEPTPEQIAADIRREAARNAAENQNLAALKPKAAEALRLEALARVEASRATFRAELKDVLDHFKDRAGPEIERLLQRTGRTTPPGAEELFHRGRRLLSPRVKRRDEIEFMRSCGLPETVILDYLAHKLHPTINSRGGPRDADEVRIRAARMLLAIPVTGAPAAALNGPANRPLTSAAGPGR